MNSTGRSDKKISNSGIGSTRVYENIEKDRSIVAAIREEYYSKQQQEVPSVSTPLQTALLARTKSKLRANESELTELRKLVDAGKGGVQMSLLLSNLGCQTDKISFLGGTDNNVLEKLEAAILKKEDECRKARQVIAEANKNQQGSTARDPFFVSSVLPTQSSHSSSSKSKKKSVTRAPEMRSGGSEERKPVPKISKTSDGILTDESAQSSRSKSSHTSSSSKSKKKSVTRAPEMRSDGSEERKPVPKISKASDGILTDESSHSSRSKSSLSSISSRTKKKSVTRAPEMRSEGFEERRPAPKSSKTSAGGQ
jgi:hypothetical protein